MAVGLLISPHACASHAAQLQGVFKEATIDGMQFSFSVDQTPGE